MGIFSSLRRGHDSGRDQGTVSGGSTASRERTHGQETLSAPGTAPKDQDRYIAVERTTLPLSPDMIRMMVQELPIMDSVSRARVYHLLRQWQEEHPENVMNAIEELPDEIRHIMDLN